MNKFSSSIRKTVSRKQFKYGGYAVLLTLGAIAFIVLLNIGLTVLENNFDLRIDMSQNKKLTLTDQTKKIVSGLQKDIYVYTLFTPGNEDAQITELLHKFKGVSSHIIIENRDPEKDPLFMKQFTKEGETIAAGSVIVSDADKKFYRVLTQDALYQYQYNDQANPTTPTGVLLVAEGAITQSVNYIASGFIPTIYVVEGHGELAISDLYYAQQALSQENYKLESINLAQAPDKVKAGDLLMFLAPTTDITDAERDLLKPLMEKGGRFYFLFDPVKLGSKKLTNLESLLRLYDITLKTGLVYEANSQYMATNDNPLIIVPKVGTHAATAAVATNKVSIVVQNSGAISLPDVAPESTMTITPLLTSSSDSYLKQTVTTDTKKATGDESGPFTLAAAVEKTNGSNTADSTRFIIAYNTDFLTNATFVQRSSNIYMLMDGAAWMRNAEKDIYIRGKTVSSQLLGFQNAFQRTFVMILSCFLAPVLLLVAGIIIYLKRKHL